MLKDLRCVRCKHLLGKAEHADKVQIKCRRCGTITEFVVL